VLAPGSSSDSAESPGVNGQPVLLSHAAAYRRKLPAIFRPPASGNVEARWVEPSRTHSALELSVSAGYWGSRGTLVKSSVPIRKQRYGFRMACGWFRCTTDRPGAGQDAMVMRWAGHPVWGWWIMRSRAYSSEELVAGGGSGLDRLGSVLEVPRRKPVSGSALRPG